MATALVIVSYSARSCGRHVADPTGSATRLATAWLGGAPRPVVRVPRTCDSTPQEGEVLIVQWITELTSSFGAYTRSPFARVQAYDV